MFKCNKQQESVEKKWNETWRIGIGNCGQSEQFIIVMGMLQSIASLIRLLLGNDNVKNIDIRSCDISNYLIAVKIFFRGDIQYFLNIETMFLPQLCGTELATPDWLVYYILPKSQWVYYYGITGIVCSCRQNASQNPWVFVHTSSVLKCFSFPLATHSPSNKLPFLQSALWGFSGHSPEDNSYWIGEAGSFDRCN